jgi:hypothetical protein
MWAIKHHTIFDEFSRTIEESAMKSSHTRRGEKKERNRKENEWIEKRTVNESI